MSKHKSSRIHAEKQESARKPWFELLRDPRWQKLRLQVMERDEWRCRACGSASDTLNVHHLWYGNTREDGIRRRFPWEYEIRDLVTLCEDCHTTEHQERPDVEADILQILRQLGFLYSDVDWLKGLLADANCTQPPLTPSQLMNAIERAVVAADVSTT